MKVYDIWAEGYAATGETGVAHLIGQACAEYCKKHDKYFIKNEDSLYGCFKCYFTALAKS